jgi:hypothetical protein
MATNGWEITTDDYDLYSSEGVPESLPGTPTIDESGHLVFPDQPYFSPSTTPQSTMDEDSNNTGPMTDFFTNFPISIDINGYIFYYNENTGINIRGPQGHSVISFDELSEEEKRQIKGEQGDQGPQGNTGEQGPQGETGPQGKSAYQVWLDQGHSGTEQDFFQYIANLSNSLVVAGGGQGSLKLNYVGVNSAADGVGATAAGQNTNAAHTNSFAAGLGTITGANNQVVLGKYNNPKATNAFEIGNGIDNDNRDNILEVTWSGNLKTKGEIIDGNGNQLSNKVDKIGGKGLSTNDFSNTYKSFIDNFEIDNVLSLDSTNPVQNKVVASAINNLVIAATDKPQQQTTNLNRNFPFFYPGDTSTQSLNLAYYSNTLTWNPYTRTLNTNSNSISSYSNVFTFGTGLVAGKNNQIVFGKNNVSNDTDVFIIGNGGSTSNRSNIFRVSSGGDVVTSGNVTDGQGNILANKQDILTFDTEPTEDSTNIVNSGDLYDYLVQHGIDPEGTIVIPELDTLQTAVNNLQLQVSAINTQINVILNRFNLVDDTYPNNIYNLGVNEGKLYIQRQETSTETQGEGGENNDNDSE